MRTRTKACIAFAALVVAAAAVTDARAGNVAAPVMAFEVYNLELNLGEGFKYLGTNAAALVVDDITYTVDMDPCDTSGRCVMFDHETTSQVGDGMLVPPPGPVGNSQLLYAGPNSFVIRWAEAKGTHFRADMLDQAGAAGEVGAPQHQRFDSISHTVYGQFLGREEYHYPTGSSAEAVMGMGVGISASVDITPSSQSRHYQTPYVQLGALIRFDNTIRPPPGTFTNSLYVQAIAYVKGRVFTDPAAAPVRNTNFQILTP